jgi:hypothetical protein
LPDQWKEPIVLLIYKTVIKLTVELSCHVTSISFIQNVIQYHSLKAKSIYIYIKLTGDRHCGFRHNRSTTDQIFCIHQILEKKWEYNETVHQLFIDLKKAYDLVRREALYSILIEFGVPMKLLRLIKMYLNVMYIKVCIGKHLSDNFPIQNGLKQGDTLLILLFVASLRDFII